MNYYIMLIAAGHTILFHAKAPILLPFSLTPFLPLIRRAEKKELQIVAYRLATRTFAQRNQQERLGGGGKRLDRGRDRNEMTRFDYQPLITYLIISFVF